MTEAIGIAGGRDNLQRGVERGDIVKVGAFCEFRAEALSEVSQVQVSESSEVVASTTTDEAERVARALAPTS